MDTCKLEEVIVTTLTRKGDGETTPIRCVTQYWSKDGQLLASRDPRHSYALSKAIWLKSLPDGTTATPEALQEALAVIVEVLES